MSVLHIDTWGPILVLHRALGGYGVAHDLIGSGTDVEHDFSSEQFWHIVLPDTRILILDCKEQLLAVFELLYCVFPLHS